MKHATPRGLVRPDSGIVCLQGSDKPGSGRGHPHGYSLNRVYQIAIMVELAKFGTGPTAAADTAITFSDTGCDSLTGDDGAPRRMPGQLYATGTTLLVMVPGRRYGEVVQVQPGQPWFDAWSAISGGEASAVVLNLNELVARVHERLGIR
jgi:hypothetical protein